jgi:hypothetical protein
MQRILPATSLSIYDRDLGPVSFAGYHADLAGRLAARRPLRALETAAGTGSSPAIRAAESVAFEQADVTALPLPGWSL